MSSNKYPDHLRIVCNLEPYRVRQVMHAAKQVYGGSPTKCINEVIRIGMDVLNELYQLSEPPGARSSEHEDNAKLTFDKTIEFEYNNYTVNETPKE